VIRNYDFAKFKADRTFIRGGDGGVEIATGGGDA
jgi:hypothetical protein